MRLLLILGMILSVNLFAKQRKTTTQRRIVKGEYTYRDINRPVIELEPDQKIIIYSIPRTGSTLLYMVFQYLFETKIKQDKSFDKKVVKYHIQGTCEKYCKNHSETFVVIPIRNPIDTLFSQTIAKNGGSCNVKEVIHQRVASLVRETEIISKFINSHPKNKLFVCNYDEFTKDLDPLFTEIEMKFHVQIPIAEKEKIKRIFSKDGVRKIASQFDRFVDYDFVTNVHGNHLLSDTYPIDSYLTQEDKQEVWDSLDEKTKAFFEDILGTKASGVGS